MRVGYVWENYQRAILAFTSILFTFLAFVCLVIAAATPGWTRIIDTDPRDAAEDGVLASFGLFRGRSKIDSGFSAAGREQKFDTDDFLSELPVWRIWLTLALIIAAFVIAWPAIFFAFLSTYQTVTTMWRGPAVAYLFNLTSAFFAFFALGVYLDFFIWDIDDGHDILVQKKPDLSLRVFRTKSSLSYSFVLLCVACGCLLASVILCWRLVVLLPSFAGPVSVFKSEASLDLGQQDMQLQQTQIVEQQMATMSPGKRPSINTYEESSVLY